MKFVYLYLHLQYVTVYVFPNMVISDIKEHLLLSAAALADVSELEAVLHSIMLKTDNYQRLLELQKDLIGVDNLATPTREFIRLGCLSKLSGKGLQQRMFFLVRGSNVYKNAHTYTHTFP